jgi:hypothetical protein
MGQHHVNMAIAGQLDGSDQEAQVRPSTGAEYEGQAKTGLMLMTARFSPSQLSHHVALPIPTAA